MKALVTGATGFIGQHLVRKLLKENWSVRCLARKTSIMPDDFADSVEWVIGDLQSRESLLQACSDVDTIFHLAGLVKARRYEEFFNANAKGTENLISAAIETSKSAKFIYISSQAAGGPSKKRELKTENEPANPVSNYGKSKLEGENIVLSHKDEIKCVIIRPSAVYGPGDRGTIWFFKIAKLHINPYIGFKVRYISLIFVEDLVNLIVSAAKSDIQSGEIFYASDGTSGYPWNRVINEIARSLGTFTIPIFLPNFIVWIVFHISGVWSRIRGKLSMLNPDKYKEIIHQYWLCSSEKSKRDLDFKPMYNLESGIKKAIDWYREKGWI